jgi:hypothetical protein
MCSSFTARSRLSTLIHLAGVIQEQGEDRLQNGG